MSDGRGQRKDAAASQNSQRDSEMGKVKHHNIFVSKKYDGLRDSLVTSNLIDVSFTEGVPEVNSYIPQLSDLNENSELLQDLSFLNLTGVSPAEQDILNSIIHDSKWYSESLFCLMRASPTPGDPNVDIESSERCLTETGGEIEGDGIPEVSGDPDGVSGHLVEVHHLQNGPVVDLSQPHMNPVDDGSMSNVMTSGVPPNNLRPYYANQQPHLAVSTSGPGQPNVPPSVSGGMLMYPHQMQQLIQSGQGGYPMPVGYPSLHYGYSQHGGQPHVTYVSPTGDALSPDSVHMGPPPQQGHKSHHDVHHGIHTSANSGSGNYSKGRNTRRENVKQQQQQQQHQPYYYSGYGYAPAPGMHYHSHQQLAQNVTGSPIIMPTPHGNIYPSYHQHPQQMYPPNSAVPGEIEHHQSNVGIPQPMTHISGEIPPYAQHHHVTPMYHHSPSHSGSNRSGNYSQSSRGVGNSVPSAPLEHPVNSNNVPNSSDIQPDPEAILDGVKVSEGDISQSVNIAAGHHIHENREEIIVASSKKETDYNSHHEQSQKKSIMSEVVAASSQDSSMQVVSSIGGGSNEIPRLRQKEAPVVIADNSFESLSEPSRDTEVIDRIAPMPTTDKASSVKVATGGRVNRSSNNSQHKSTSSVEAESNKETPTINGEVKDIKSGKGAPRDKLSAEPVTVPTAVTNKKDSSSVTDVSRQPAGNQGGMKATDTKSNNKSIVSASVSNNGSSRSVNVVSNNLTTASPKDILSATENVGESNSSSTEVSGSGDFPQLSANCSSNSLNTTSSSLASSSSSAGSTGAAPRGRSWASIASANKSQSDGANLNSRRTIPGASVHGIEQGSGDAMMIASGGRLSGGEQYNNFVPSCPNDKSLAKTLGGELDLLMSDSSGINGENDPVALALGEFLRNYTLDHHSIALTPRGLYNQSNYCYINATLQSLLACPPFVNLFRAMGDILNKRQCRATPIIQNVFELVSEFEPLLRGNANKKDRMKDVFHVGTNLEPLGIRKCLGLLEGSTFKVEGRQEDAEEFLSHLLNGLHDEMLKVMKLAEQHKERGVIKNKPRPVTAAPTASTPPVPTGGPGATNGGGVEISGDEDDDQWQVMGAKNKSCLTRKTAVSKTPISEAFLGQMCYFYRESTTGSNKSATHQPFYTLQLDIQNDNIRSVRDALEAIVAREEVSGVVSANGAEVEAWRQLSLEELPVVLILHLKRFVYEQKSNKIKKIDKKLDFGIDLEIFKEMLSPNAKGKYNARQRQYKLFGVVYHDGEETHKGHYIADSFHASGGSMWGQCGWLRFDDTSVKQIPENQMLNPQPPRVPYLLYYRRADTLLSHVTQQQQQHKKERP